jgi:Ca-activated chloride channel family protein
MTRFASPLLFALALLVVARIVLIIRDRRARFAAFPMSSLSLVASRPTLRVRLESLPFILECIAALLLVVALARPQRVTRLATSDRYGIDIVVALDASGSMAAEDFKPRNRFAVAKDLIGDFIARRQDDRVGIVTFGGRAATRVPITFDREVAKAILDKAEIGDNGNGTAIGHAIATSVNRLRTSRSRTRVIILVTDGVNNAGSIEPLTAAQLATRTGIRIYTIGVGSRGRILMPRYRQNALTGDIEKYYDVVTGDLDEQTLAAIAKMTGGAYFRATDAATMGDILSRIDVLEKTRLSAPKSERIDELYLTPLILSLFIFALSLLLGETALQKVPA